MLEKNKDKLSKLIQDLPVFLPPDVVWQKIEMSLPSAGNGLDRLPQYQPSEQVWPRIEAGLHRNAGRPRRYFLWISAAAALLAIVWFFPANPFTAKAGPSVSGISFSREIVEASLLQRDWEQDAGDFEIIGKLCANATFTCANPDMQSLQMEMEELSNAKEALEEALGKYGADPDMIAQLAQIERTRTAILKRMLDYFL